MPTVNPVTTKSAQQVWASPDGSRKIHEVILDYQGQQFKAKTYSDSIAAIGWSGSVDSEERPGRNGMETFVKQTPKPGGFGGGIQHQRGGKVQDPQAMYVAYAKDIAVAFIGFDGKLNLPEYKKALEAVVEGGKKLFEGSKEEAPAADNITTVFGNDVVVEDGADEPLKLSDLDNIGI